MLAKIILSLFLLSSIVFGKSYLFSPIPAVTNEVLKIDPSSCSENCQLQLLNQQKPFSFIANYDKNSSDDRLKNAYQELRALLNLEEFEEIGTVRVAVLVPSSTIGRYASIVTDTVNAYLLNKGIDFSLEVYDSKNESLDALRDSVKMILQDGHKYVIAPLTSKGAENLVKFNLPLQVFIPTINKEDVKYYGNNIIYGGIDYKKQFEKLLKYNDSDKVVIFDEPMPLTKKLTKYAKSKLEANISVVELKTRRTIFKNVFEKEKIDENTTLILNTRPVMSSLILSQLTYNDVNVSKVFSTQLNYTPLIIRLTQAQDLEKLYIANSISYLDEKIFESNKIFNNDINFNWIIFSTTIMTDLVFKRSQKDFSGKNTHYGIDVRDNEIEYDIKIFKVAHEKFVDAPKSLDEQIEEIERIDLETLD